MFVSESKYREAVAVAGAWKRKHDKLHYQFRRLLGKWNDLVENINRKGGEEFLNSEMKSQFSKEEIAILIRLCHPDRHNNSTNSTEITKKLLVMR